MDGALRWIGRRWSGALVLVAVVFALFAAAATNTATLDGKHFLTEDPRVIGLQAGALLGTGYWHSDVEEPGRADLYRPLTLLWMSAWWNCATPEQWSDGRPTMLNLANLGLHALGVVLRFWLFLRLLAGRPHAGALAFFAALLLAVHPIATETVATQVGAAEGLAVVFGSAALLAWHRWQSGGGRRAAFGFALWLLLGLLAKENVVAIAAIAPLGSRLLLGRSWRDSAIVAAVALVPVAVWVALRWCVTGSVAGVGDPVLAGFPPGAALQMALAAIGDYDLLALLWPFRLLAFVGHQQLWPPAGFTDLRVVAGLLAVVGLGAGIAVAWRRSRTAAFALLFFALALLPVSNLIVPIGALAATRFLYLPMTGLALAAALLLQRLAGAGPKALRRAAAVLAVLLPLLFAVATVRELPAWRSEATLARTMGERSADGFFAFNLGAALLPAAEAAQRRGDQAATAAVRAEAVAGFERALSSPRPRIPGTELVPEDLLDNAYKAAMNLVTVRMLWQQDPAGARSSAEAGRDLAQQGDRQSGALGGRTQWRPLGAEADCLLAEIAMHEAQLPANASRREQLLADAEQHLQQARAFDPEGFRAEEVAIRLLALRNDAAAVARAQEALYARARPLVVERSAALRAVLAYADYLDKHGQRERSLRVVLDAIVAGQVRIGDADGFFEPGRRGLAAPDAETRALARRALGIFLERAGPQHAERVAEVRRLLALPPR